MAVDDAAKLTPGDIGTVPRDGALGKYGVMNWGLIAYHPKPNAGDVASLAKVFKVKEQQVRRFFGKPDKHGRIEQRNAVNPRLAGKRPFQLAAADQRRVFLGACLVAGGLVREPIFHAGDKEGNPYIEVYPFGTLGECVAFIEAVYRGDFDALLMLGWAKIEIAARGGETPWEVVIERYYPESWEEYELDKLPDDYGDDNEEEEGEE